MGMRVGKSIGKIMDRAGYNIGSIIVATVSYFKPEILSCLNPLFILLAIGVKSPIDVYALIFDFMGDYIGGMMGVSIRICALGLAAMASATLCAI